MRYTSRLFIILCLLQGNILTASAEQIASNITNQTRATEIQQHNTIAEPINIKDQKQPEMVKLLGTKEYKGGEIIHLKNNNADQK